MVGRYILSCVVEILFWELQNIGCTPYDNKVMVVGFAAAKDGNGGKTHYDGEADTDSHTPTKSAGYVGTHLLKFLPSLSMDNDIITMQKKMPDRFSTYTPTRDLKLSKAPACANTGRATENA